MKQPGKLLTILLCVALLVCLCGCWQPVRTGSFGEAPQVAAPKNEITTAQDGALAGSGYFTSPTRADVAYPNMAVEPLTLGDVTEITNQLAYIAVNGGKQDAFTELVLQAEQLLYTIDTNTSLLELQQYNNPASVDAATAYSDSSQLYNEAVDAFWTALHLVAASNSAWLLDELYDEGYVAQFERYVPEDSSAVNTLFAQETALTQQYEAQIVADSPDYDAICQIFVELVQLRQQIAASAGYDSYCDYAYEGSYARSYTPQDAQALWSVAKEQFAPLIAAYQDGIYAATDKLYYGSRIDCSEAQILAALQLGAARMSPEVEAAVDYLTGYGLHDIAPSDTKLSTGFTMYLPEYNQPFIFNAPYEMYYDYTDMFHEFGHFLAYFYNGCDTLYGVSDYDLSELQSQGMEVMFFQFYDDIFGQSNSAAIRADVLLNLIRSVVDGAMYDEFQQRVYAEQNLTATRVQELFEQVYLSYGNTACDDMQEEWMGLIHNFEYPFYYISYAASAMPALELFIQQQSDPATAMDTYLKLAAMSDETYYLTDALAEVGLGDIFEDDTGVQLVEALETSGVLSP